MNLSDLQQRYYSDPEFHAGVKLMVNLVRRCHLTPLDLRQAAFLAAVQCEQEVVREQKLCSCGGPDCNRHLDQSL